MISSPLSYTNMLIIHVWENTDQHACKLMRVKKKKFDFFPQFCLGTLALSESLHCSQYLLNSFINLSDV